MADRRAHDVCAVGGLHRLPLLAISRWVRYICVERACVRSVRGVHHRLDVLDRHTRVPAHRALFHRGQLSAVVADEHDDCRHADLLHLFFADHDRDLRDTECSRTVGGQVAQQRRSGCAMVRYVVAGRLCAGELLAVRAGNGHQSAHDRARIPAQRCHFLDDARFRLDRARSRVIHGRRDPGPAPYRAESFDSCRTHDRRRIHHRHREHSARHPAGARERRIRCHRGDSTCGGASGTELAGSSRGGVRGSRPHRQPVFVARRTGADTRLSWDCRLPTAEFRPNSSAPRVSRQRDLGAGGTGCGLGRVGSEWDVRTRCIQCPHRDDGRHVDVAFPPALRRRHQVIFRSSR